MDVQETQDPPTLSADAFTMDEDGQLFLEFTDLLANDVDPDGDVLNILNLSQVRNGTAVIDDEQVIFTPTENFTGAASFRYRVEDAGGNTDTARVTITVEGRNDAPVAVNDSFVMDQASTLTISEIELLVNDFDEENNDLSLIAVQDAATGAVDLEGGVVTFTPFREFNGETFFRYIVEDSGGARDTGIVEIFVNEVDLSRLATDGDDNLRGTNKRDVIDLLDGDDRYIARGGSDRVNGNDGDDEINGGGGKDRLFGDADKDELNGNGGKDSLFGGDGSDTLKGGNGNDALNGGAGRDLLFGGKGRDTFIFTDDNFGNDVIRDFNERDDSLVFEEGSKVEVFTNRRDTFVEVDDFRITLEDVDLRERDISIDFV